MPELAYLNGSFGPIASAMVSIEDRGFQFGDAVYSITNGRTAADGRLWIADFLSGRLMIFERK